MTHGKTRIIAAIRTHRWDEDAIRLAEQLRPVFGDALVVVFHDRPRGTDPGLPVIDLNSMWLRRNGLRAVPDWGWRCGDYFAYALRAARPDADQYWLIEPDVWFAKDPHQFFGLANDLPGDLLGPAIERLGADHRFARGLSDLPPYRAIFALTRFSARALDHLFEARRAYSLQGTSPRFFTNDEVFCYSTLMARKDFVTGSFVTDMPDWFPAGSMRTDPDILIDTLVDLPRTGVFHPVRGRASFKRAVAARLAGTPAFLGAMQASLAHLGPADIADVAADVAERVAEQLTLAAKRGLRASYPEEGSAT
jgi:hypothetical protein